LKEKTLVLVKPEGIQRGLIGEFIKRFEQKALKIIGLKIIIPDKALVEKQYIFEPEWAENTGRKTREAYEKKGIKLTKSNAEIGKEVRKKLIDYLNGQPVIAIALEGYHAIEIVRKIIGHTEPRQAMPGTIRGDFSVDSYDLGDAFGRPVKNLVHASDSPENGLREINVWFDKKELIDYEMHEQKIAH